MDRQQTQQPNGLATAGMILGISSIVLSLFLGFILGVLAIIFSAIGLKKSPRNGQAIAGLVTGIIGTLIGLVVGTLLMIGIAVSVSETALDSSVKSNADALVEYAEGSYSQAGSYPSFDEAKNEMADEGITVDPEGNGLGGDLIYIPCYGDGAIVWYWSIEADDYVSIDLGNTDSCEWND